MSVLANEALGEVELKSRLDETTYLFWFGPNQLANIEEALKKDLSEIMADLSQSRMSVRMIRTVAKLSYVMPKGKGLATDSLAGDILNAVGYKPFVEAFAKGMTWVKVGMDDAEGSANPPAPSGDVSA